MAAVKAITDKTVELESEVFFQPAAQNSDSDGINCA
jgi:hypothetical protein